MLVELFRGGTLAGKLAHPGFLIDCAPLLLAGVGFYAEEDRAFGVREEYLKSGSKPAR